MGGGGPHPGSNAMVRVFFFFCHTHLRESWYRGLAARDWGIDGVW